MTAIRRMIKNQKLNLWKGLHIPSMNIFKYGIDAKFQNKLK